jgi:histidinol-phosphate aminotransferase
VSAEPGSPLSALPLREDLRGLEPYGAPQLDVPVRLNTNENPHPPPESLVEDMAAAVADVARGLNRYPDREATRLREDLARYLGNGLDAAQVWAANGSNEVLQQLCQAFGGPGRVALGFEPSYSMHRLIARATATGWAAESRRADFTLDPDEAAAAVRRHSPSIVFLCSPNNPTATALPLDVVSAVCACAPGVVVVDEAYAEFAHAGVPSALALLPRHERLIVTRTMSKAFAFAGARVGYLAAQPAVVDALRLVRLPYHLSAVTQVVARSALAHRDDLLATVAAVKAERDRIVAELRARGLAVADSDANFVLFGGFPDQRIVWQGLLDRGVLVRDVGLPGWLRVTAGLPEEVDAFLSALDAVLAGAVLEGVAR